MHGLNLTAAQMTERPPARTHGQSISSNGLKGRRKGAHSYILDAPHFNGRAEPHEPAQPFGAAHRGTLAGHLDAILRRCGRQRTDTARQQMRSASKYEALGHRYADRRGIQMRASAYQYRSRGRRRQTGSPEWGKSTGPAAADRGGASVFFFEWYGGQT